MSSKRKFNEISAAELEDDIPKTLEEFDKSKDFQLEEGMLSSAKEEAIRKQIEEEYMKDLMYDSEDSENERTLNTTGNIPKEWYDDYDHVGYDLEGKPIGKGKTEDEIDKLLARDQNPWSVWNDKTGKRESITPAEMDIIKRLKDGVLNERYSASNWFIELTKEDDTLHAATNRPLPKSYFLPSVSDEKKVMKMVQLIRAGKIPMETEEKKDDKKVESYLMWDENNKDDIPSKRFYSHIPPPKRILPGHEESYNPPEEYLFDERQMRTWMSSHPSDRLYKFIPQKFGNMRHITSYKHLSAEMFERLMDLYLATRVNQKKRNIQKKVRDPLPTPEELKPFPTTQMMLYSGHEDTVTSVSFDPTGQWFASCSEDSSIRIWEVSTGRQMARYFSTYPPTCVAWNPNPEICLVAVAAGEFLYLYHPQKCSNPKQKINTNAFFKGKKGSASFVNWMTKTDENDDLRCTLKFEVNATTVVKKVTWHPKGDYFATICPEGQAKSVIMHQLSKMTSQIPFSKYKGTANNCAFHPTKPYFFVSNEKNIRIYDLANQTHLKKLQGPRGGIVTALHVHPGGDNFLIGSYSSVMWFDIDLGHKPYRVFKYHKQVVKAVRYHQKYPLFATCSDDAKIHIFHNTVYDDLNKNAMIVPLKVLHGHTISKDYGVQDIQFHPTQPWILSAGADNKIILWTNLHL